MMPSRWLIYKGAFIIICLVYMVTFQIHYNAANAYSSPTNNNKPPRGYCTQISRAINSNSRCYEHLIGSGNRLNLGIDNNNGNNNLNKNNAREIDDDNNNNNKQARLLHEVGGGEGGRGGAAPFNSREELVYVRLETVGSTIGDLKTSPINERLLVGVLTRLLGNTNGIQLMKEDNNKEKKERKTTTTEIKENNSMKSNIRAQILSSDESLEGSKLADKCRLSIERFLCRLAYPVCHFRRTDISALVRPPCREDCLLLKDVLCSNLDWSQFTTVLNAAFNETLSSVINALDLEAQGEQLTIAGKGPRDAADAHQTQFNHNKLLSTTTKHEQGEEYGTQNRHNNWPEKETRKDYSLLTDYNLNSSIHLYWPHEHSIERCELLPPLRSIENLHSTIHSKHHSNQNDRRQDSYYHNNNNKRAKRGFFGLHRFKWPICSNAHLTSSSHAAFHSKDHQTRTLSTSKRECLLAHDGIDYEGYVNHTRSGLVCQKWQNQWPHVHTRSELLFDNMKEAHNYCRNPGGIELKPFCYTMDKNVRWEYCDIVKC